MLREAISITPPSAAKLEEVGRLLRRGPVTLHGSDGEKMLLPEPLQTLLKDAVKGLANGDSLRLIKEEKHLTTQEAAELLGVSRPYLIRLLDLGEMRYGLVGKHRRIRLSEVLTYAERRAARKAALDQIAREAFEAGLYDEPLPPRRAE